MNTLSQESNHVSLFLESWTGASKTPKVMSHVTMQSFMKIIIQISVCVGGGWVGVRGLDIEDEKNIFYYSFKVLEQYHTTL